MRNDQITLITVTGETKDADGFVTNETTVTTEIFAEVKAVNRNEYYAALKNGIKISLIFAVDVDDFKLGNETITVSGKTITKKPTKVIFDSTTYLIVRTYGGKVGTMELVCEEVE